jgi:hypothetical protein
MQLRAIVHESAQRCLDVGSEFDLEALRRNGFAIARGMFSAPEILRFRNLLATAKSRAVAQDLYDVDPKLRKLTMLRGDVFSIPELAEVDYVVFDRRMIDCAKKLLGSSLVYHGDSAVQIGEGARGFHKDNADRTNAAGPDWVGEYGLIRFAIYLEDHTAFSGGLKVRAGSHRFVSRHRGRATNLQTLPGDVVCWYLTTSHSGNFVRLRGFPNACLHPRIERLVSDRFRVAEHQERMAMFCTFSRPGQHLDHYIEYQASRADVRAHWRYCGAGDRIDAFAAGRGIELRKPVAEFAVAKTPETP